MRLLEVHIEVIDIERSLALYSKLLSFVKIHRWDDDSAVALISEDGTAFGIWAKGKSGIHQGRGGQHVHFAFQVAPHELSIYRKRIVSAGLEPLDYLWPSGHQSVYFFDYDNHQGEFMTVDWLGNAAAESS